jgi:hypothetical protein
MTDDVTRSVGQGNFYSRVAPYCPSIIKSLHTRSLTGHRLNLHVHQHLGYKLHIVWNSVKKGVQSESGIERRFSTYEEVTSFCTDLTKGRSEGLCDCVGEGVIIDKAEMCFRPCTLSQRGIPPYIANSWIKFLQENDKTHSYWCRCKVQSTDVVMKWKH